MARRHRRSGPWPRQMLQRPVWSFIVDNSVKSNRLTLLLTSGQARSPTRGAIAESAAQNPVRRSSKSEHGPLGDHARDRYVLRRASWLGRCCDGSGMSHRDGGLLAVTSSGGLGLLQ
jgi:hypothetical protein